MKLAVFESLAGNRSLSCLLAFLVLAPFDLMGGDPPDQDRKAILGMAGEYEVSFDFRETVPLVKDYQLTKPYHSEANEVVIVIEDSGDRIALQHILTVGNGKGVVKHWKQIWTWEDTRLTEFQGREKWRVRELPAEKVKGTWSQLVTQTDDSPRYESYGVWKHDGGYSRWQSHHTNRPLPRREYTKRSDYEVLVGINRHELTPYGWAHFQDNLKEVLKPDGKVSHYIARESGLNLYDKVTDYDFSAATEYWEATREFWAKVSAFWEKVQADRESFGITGEIDGISLTRKLMDFAESIGKGENQVPGDEDVAEMISPYLK